MSFAPEEFTTYVEAIPPEEAPPESPIQIIPLESPKTPARTLIVISVSVSVILLLVIILVIGIIAAHDRRRRA